MSKSLSSAGTVTVSTDGSVAADEFWVQSSSLIDCSGKHGLNAEIKVTFANETDVSGKVTIYTVGSNDAGTDITSSAQAFPIAVFDPVQNTTVKALVTVPTIFDDQVGFAVENTDENENAVTVTISYKTVTL